MRNQRHAAIVGKRLSIILAVALATLWAVPSVSLGAGAPVSAQVRLNKLSPQLMEITGGSGKDAWRIPYGRWSDEDKAQLLDVPGDRAWFSHAGWLRLIDTKKGVVLGRWHFPGEITGFAPQGDKLEVTIEINEGGTRQFHYKVLFDPQAPKVFFYQTGYLILSKISQAEANLGGFPFYSKPSLETARRLIPVYEEALRRDPVSPWLRFTYGSMLKSAGDPRAHDVLAEAVRMPGADFTELLPMSSSLERIGEIDLAREAFERGYRDFWERGNDPRLMHALIVRLVLYTNFDWDKIPLDHRQELIERLYRFGPHAEGSEYAWKLYADYFEKNGPAELARLWRAREQEAGGRSGLFFLYQILLFIDVALLFVFAAILAGLVYIVVLFRRYRPQRLLDVAARKRQPGGPRVMHFFGLEYWSRADRLGFLLIALIGWYAAGLLSVGVRGIYRFAAAPLRMANGNYAGPATKAYFERLPATPDRDLLLAIAHQHSGEPADAERLYRTVPQFPESWNNLGVILKQAGKEQEARQAFEHALQLDPNLAEAAYNLGRGTPSLWTELHEKYLPGQPMVVPPQRDRIVRAFLGGSPAALLFNALGGPFAAKLQLFFDLAASLDFGLGLGRAVFVVAALTLAPILGLAIVFLLPTREVTQPPGRAHIGWQTLFPGTAPVWGFLGGLVLVVWCYFFWQDWLLFWQGSPRIITYILFPNLKTAFGIPGDWSNDVIKRLINPSWIGVVAAPAVLFVANLFLIWRSRRRGA